MVGSFGEEIFLNIQPLWLFVHAGTLVVSMQRDPGLQGCVLPFGASAPPDLQPAALSHRMSPTAHCFVLKLPNSQCVVCPERLEKSDLESIGDNGSRGGRGREDD